MSVVHVLPHSPTIEFQFGAYVNDHCKNLIPNNNRFAEHKGIVHRSHRRGNAFCDNSGHLLRRDHRHYPINSWQAFTRTRYNFQGNGNTASESDNITSIPADSVPQARDHYSAVTTSEINDKTSLCFIFCHFCTKM